MREVIVAEWRDSLGILHQEEVRELVRCKDCKWSRWSERDERYECLCHIPIFAVLSLGFCDKGEKKEIDM